MKVVNYMSSVPGGNTNVQKEQLIEYFHKGVLANNDKSVVQRRHEVLDQDVAVIQGWVYADKSAQHLRLRDGVIQTQVHSNRYVIVADANLFKYADPLNTHGYLRYSANGIFPTTGIYFDDVVDPKRWMKLASHHKISMGTYVKTGKKIVLCCQRNKGWSMKGIPVNEWVYDTIKKIKKNTDKQIVIRSHPGDKRSDEWLKITQDSKLRKFINSGQVTISRPGTPLNTDLNNAWAVVNHNSSSIVGPIMKGIHAFVTDPDDSQCKDVANTDLRMLENPKEFDREAWAQKKAMSHWSFDELKSGEAWAHMRPYVSQ